MYLGVTWQCRPRLKFSKNHSCTMCDKSCCCSTSAAACSSSLSCLRKEHFANEMGQLISYPNFDNFLVRPKESILVLDIITMQKQECLSALISRARRNTDLDLPRDGDYPDVVRVLGLKGGRGQTHIDKKISMIATLSREQNRSTKNRLQSWVHRQELQSLLKLAIDLDLPLLSLM